ncbi:uncharacterized protein B0H18DRAFT_956300 [Fomitopsis serialis]|uniref:uncharacterized protein n=1 Tax=Fomitopsis serialis TaxID=139415 RepID=UPI002008B969|nr:uncharacterized protein B0H18DRAFT_956300 [Neoantrodia serialis]KAH9922420.1 hypothetical protein B0H18DRAFT_956300 [Neoantrodia serialis]
MTTCNCTPARDHDPELMRDVLPQRPADVDEILATHLFPGIYPSLYFGRGMSIDALRTSSVEEVANAMDDGGWDTPFDKWPDHDPQDTEFKKIIALESADDP